MSLRILHRVKMARGGGVFQATSGTASSRGPPAMGRYRVPEPGRLFSTERETSTVPFKYLLGLMPLAAFALGVWQVRRLKWKEDLIEHIDQKLHQEPVRLPAAINTDKIDEFAYRKVYVVGEFDHEREILVGPRTRDGVLGYYVLTPLRRGDGKDEILVNRGFVKRERVNQRQITTGPVRITGMLRSQEKRNRFTPVNSPQKGEFVFVDIAEIAEHCGTSPVLVDAILVANAGQIRQMLDDGVPVARPARIELRNMHASYALTWFSLSLFTGVLFFRVTRAPKTRAAKSYALAVRRGEDV